VKVCSYAPWSIKLCLSGHEWAKRQLDKRGIGYEALDNGFLSCARPTKLQEICDSLGPEDIDRVFRKWLGRIPLPLRRHDRQAGYDWDLSIWQMEVSLLSAMLGRSTRPADRPLVRLDVDLRPDVSLGSFAGANAILSPDGTRLVYVSPQPALRAAARSAASHGAFRNGRRLRAFLLARRAGGCVFRRE
jgi:hypothetical protein